MSRVKHSSTFNSLIDYLVEPWRGSRKQLNYLVRLACQVREPGSHGFFYVSNPAAIAFTEGCRVSPKALIVLKERAINDSEPEIRSAALRAILMGWISEKEVHDFVMERALSDPEAEVRASAHDSLMLFCGDVVDVYEFVKDRAVSDPKAEVRIAAFRSLASLDFLHERATSDPDREVRAAALQEISAIWAIRAAVELEDWVRAVS